VDIAQYSSCPVPFSAAEFFRDAPWLNIPLDRKADIIVEPLYPRLGLLGGAPEGKMSKLAALAAARKKKDSEKSSVAPEQLSNTEQTEKKSTQRSLAERLAVNSTKVPEKAGGISALSKESRLGNRLSKPRSHPVAQDHSEETVSRPSVDTDRPAPKPLQQQPAENANLRAPPSTFATAIVGDGNYLSTSEPGHLCSNKFDVMQVYGQDFTEAFDFVGPSPDDVVINAQSASKGLPIRRMR
jgi:elongation factor 1 alpha-like protein